MDGFGDQCPRQGRGRAHSLSQDMPDPHPVGLRIPSAQPTAFLPSLDGSGDGPAAASVVNSNLSAEAVEFYPKSYYEPPPPEEEPVVLSEVDNAFLMEVSHMVMELTKKPGFFDSFSSTFVELFRGRSNSPEALGHAVHMIFEQAVEQTNFRYTGARLCQTLSRAGQKDGKFRQAILKRCKEEHERREAIDPERLRGYTMFMAELYMQMDVRAGGGVVQRIEVLAQGLLALLHTLLASQPDKDGIKTICQTLKLCGCQMEEDKCNLSSLLEDTKAVVNSPDWSDRLMRDMVTKVIELRGCNWGRGGDVGGGGDRQEVSSGGDGVMYGPDGQALSHEERDFLKGLQGGDPEEEYPEEEEGSDVDFGNLSLGGDEMDDEAFEDYEKFLQMSNLNH